MRTPGATVLVDTYNQERFIEEALASVMEQDFPAAEMEILVVDDGSTDRTPEIVRKFGRRARLIRKANGGQASAFNAGIAEARGEIVAFLDGDDWWAPMKLTRVAEAMAADATLGIVGNGIIMVHLDGRRESETLRERCRFQANTREGARMLRVRGSLLGTSRMTIRRDLLRKIGPVPVGLVVEADEYLFTLASALAPAKILEETLTYYRLHEANGFQYSVQDPVRMRRKQKVMATLGEALEEELRRWGIKADASKTILEMVWAQADQLRLMEDGGLPWETLRTELKMYQILHPDAPVAHRIFKMLTLLPAAAMPPRMYYGIQQKVARSELYMRARKRWLPIPTMSHFRHEERTGT